MIDKKLKFLETIESDDGKIKWEKDKEYEVTSEYEDVYYLGIQNETPCGIGKESEGKKYVVIENGVDE